LRVASSVRSSLAALDWRGRPYPPVCVIAEAVIINITTKNAESAKINSHALTSSSFQTVVVVDANPTRLTSTDRGPVSPISFLVVPVTMGGAHCLINVVP
jgi:hypothetical protein